MADKAFDVLLENDVEDLDTLIALTKQDLVSISLVLCDNRSIACVLGVNVCDAVW